MDDDLNTPEALAVLWRLVRDKDAKGKIETIKEIDKTFGLDLLKEEKIEIPTEVKEIVGKREEARKNKDWKKSDELRDLILDLGYIIDDTKEGPRIKKVIPLSKEEEMKKLVEKITVGNLPRHKEMKIKKI